MKTLDNNFSIQKRLLWSLVLIGLLESGSIIPIPDIDYESLTTSLNQIKGGNFLSYFNNFSTSQIVSLGYFSLSIYPYINSSIIFQILIALVPNLKKLQKEEGEYGRRQLNQYIRYLTFFFAILQSIGIAFLIKPYIFYWNNFFLINLLTSLTAGSLIVLWISEVISRFGITNGSTLVIFFNILSQFPIIFKNIQTNLTNDINPIKTILLLVAFLFVMVCVIFIQETIRLIPLLLIRQDVQKANLPFRLNQAGVMPIVCSSAIMPFLVNFGTYLTNQLPLFFALKNNFFVGMGQILYCFIDFLLILTFTYFYSTLFLDPKEISTELRKMTATIPNIRPGLSTTIYLERILRRVSFFGGILLATSVLVVNLLDLIIQIPNLRGIGVSSQLIIVGVILDVLRQSELSLISERLQNSEKIFNKEYES